MRTIMYLAVIAGAVSSTVIVLNLFFGEEERRYFGYLGGAPITIAIADSEDEHIRGLSFRDSLTEQEALFFVFEEPGFYGVWMKDMRFPIDVFWFDQNLKVVHIERSLTPDSYPRVFRADVESSYILETRDGFADEFSISIGDKLSVFPDTPKLFKNKGFSAF